MASKQNTPKPSGRAGNLLSMRDDEKTPVKAALKDEKKKLSSTAYLGHLFEIKLLTLFLIQGTKRGQRFQLTTNDESMGGKFDDLIFRYEVGTRGGKQWRYRYLQAKHRTNEKIEKITTRDLFDKKDGTFSLQKYFRSYWRITERGEDIHDCIICTTLDFDADNLLKKAGIELVPITDDEDILTFAKQPNKSSPTRYRLKITDELRQQFLSDWPSDVHSLVTNLRDCAIKKTVVTHQPEIYRLYHVALIKEKVIDLKKNAFHSDFVEGKKQIALPNYAKLSTTCMANTGSTGHLNCVKHLVGFRITKQLKVHQ